MFLRVKPAVRLKGVVEAPPSKSLTHRAVMLAAMAEGRSEIRNALMSEDTKATVRVCRAFGAEIEEKDSILSVKGFSGKPKAPGEILDVGNSGTTMRIMSAVASLCREKVTLTGDESIQKRPMQPLLSALEQLGVEAGSDGGMPPVTVKGPLLGGECRIRGDISSQFISGLLLAAPLAEKDVRIRLSTPLLSRPYVDLTVEGMKKAGILIKEEEDGFFVPCRQKYRARDQAVEGDYSSAAFILAAAAITGSELTVKGLSPDSLQGDRRIIDVLGMMGAKMSVGAGEVKVLAGAKLRGVELDMGDTPDLVPVTAVLGALAEGRTTIQNVGHLRYKESDRLRAVTSELSKMGAKIKEFESGLEIEGVSSLSGCVVLGWNDHRIVMSLAVAALKAEGQTTIDSAEATDISFPGFVSALKSVGAEIERY